MAARAANPDHDYDLPAVDDDIEMEAEGEDQLDDDDSAPAGPSNQHPSLASQQQAGSASPQALHARPDARRKRVQDSMSHAASGAVDKSARKREQREREKEQQKQLLNKLIEIFEAGGGTCAVQQGQKKFPWVDLPAALIRIGCYFAGWPEKCLPKMSDKHPDRIDASTGPSQWSLKQKRAMEAQIAKGAVKVLPRPDDRAVIFEIVDDFGNVKDSTVEFSENWVRNKLLGLGIVAQSPAPHPATSSKYAPEARHMPATMTPDIDYSPPSHPLSLPPIRSHADYQERLDLPSLSKMTSFSGLQTPEDVSRSPSPLSNFSDGRYQRQPPYSSTRGGYLASVSQDDFFPTRGRVLTLEHGLPRTASSLRSTSRQKNNLLHHHPYSQLLSTNGVSSIRSRPPSPPLSHSRSHSTVTSNASELTAYPPVPPRSAASSTSTSPSTSGQTNFPSHVPNVPSSVVAWDAQNRGWVLKVQTDHGLRKLPCRDGGIVCWYRDSDQWECRSTQPEIGRAIWNRDIERWELQLPSHDEIDAYLSSSRHLARHAVYPTHLPSIEGTCAFDAEKLHAWVYYVSPAAEAQLPVTPCIIIWSLERKQWTLLSESPHGADVMWSHEDQSWHFNMQSTPMASSTRKSDLRPNIAASPRPSSAPHPNTLPPMIVRSTSPLQSPRSSAPRPMSTGGSSF